MEFREAFRLLSEINVFDRLRLALANASPNTSNGLNDNGDDIGINAIENWVKELKEELLKAKCYESTYYQKLIDLIDKYWEMRFSDPITISPPDGDSNIQFQSTNNIFEHFLDE